MRKEVAFILAGGSIATIGTAGYKYFSRPVSMTVRQHLEGQGISLLDTSDDLDESIRDKNRLSWIKKFDLNFGSEHEFKNTHIKLSQQQISNLKVNIMRKVCDRRLSMDARKIDKVEINITKNYCAEQ